MFNVFPVICSLIIPCVEEQQTNCSMYEKQGGRLWGHSETQTSMHALKTLYYIHILHYVYTYTMYSMCMHCILYIHYMYTLHCIYCTLQII